MSARPNPHPQVQQSALYGTMLDAFDLGQKGGAPESTEERKLFEAWMHGHCWEIGDWVTDARGRSYYERIETRMLWAAWRDSAHLGRRH